MMPLKPNLANYLSSINLSDTTQQIILNCDYPTGLGETMILISESLCAGGTRFLYFACSVGFGPKIQNPK